MIVRQENMHQLTESDFDTTSHLQDGGHVTFTRRSLLQ